MNPARTYPERRDDVRLLVIDPRAAARPEGPAAGLRETRTRALADFLAAGELLVVNDAATLPASLRGQDAVGRPVEARLLAARAGERFAAVLFGAGDWQVRTEDRPLPPELPVGAWLRFGALGARIAARDATWSRIVELEFDRRGDALWDALYREGRPVQYAHVAHELPLWAVQTVYASRPWSFEMPSAGRPLSWELLLALRRKGVRIVSLTHAAGLSSTGDPALDAALPLRERYDIPEATVRAVLETRARGGRVVAVGTTVVRALEGAAAHPQGLRPGIGETDLRITPAFRPRVVDGLLSGAHAAGESHFQLLAAFAGPTLLAAAASHAERAGFLTHELGDSMLVLPGALERAQRASAARRSAERASARCQPRGASSR
ncbi:MAG TPA: S-adenosylmethionine:tRNA ribosyltransferase-isomerase [Polyangia bacterium]|nr:S-adenosylmethionine:tRNA ribosyltransferase-isomerase [Polyangia bacterium]